MGDTVYNLCSCVCVLGHQGGYIIFHLPTVWQKLSNSAPVYNAYSPGNTHSLIYSLPHSLTQIHMHVYGLSHWDSITLVITLRHISLSLLSITRIPELQIIRAVSVESAWARPALWTATCWCTVVKGHTNALCATSPSQPMATCTGQRHGNLFQVFVLQDGYHSTLLLRALEAAVCLRPWDTIYLV